MVVGGRELIDTLWNVNKHWFKGFLDSDAELIDTLWNVNRRTGRTRTEAEKELIDTLWNVNIEKLLITTTGIMN